MGNFMDKRNWMLFITIGKPYSLDIMMSLFESPKRFTDLNKACPIEKTRTKRLKELLDEGLIDVTVKPIGKRNFMHYILTKKGEDTFKKVLDMTNITKPK
jgi:DNA-binding HxlR family transcriptional regulator